MLKYLSKISEQLNFFRKGVEQNMKKWSVFSENPSVIQGHIEEVEAINREIKGLKSTLSRKYAEARLVSVQKKKFISKLEKRAVGIHADEPEKLIEYGINKNLKNNKELGL